MFEVRWVNTCRIVKTREEAECFVKTMWSQYGGEMPATAYEFDPTGTFFVATYRFGEWRPLNKYGM